jgi:dTDP-4-amino-4,6-dideoxygalactose transaminase
MLWRNFGREARPGGVMSNLIRLSKSCLGQAEKHAVMKVLDHEFLGMGPEVQAFEEALSDFFGRPAVCVVNGTAALHLAVQACGICPGDEVLVPSLTYVASFQAISATGATPVSCDIDPETYVLDWKDAESRLTERTRAVMPVHYTGGVGDLASIYAFAESHNLRVVEDAAHAFGSFYAGKRVGGFGDIACFSFDGIKNITSGEGGCIVTDDAEVLRRIEDARLLGVEKDTQKRYSGQRSWDFDVTEQGWRYHMSNVMAAIGLEQLKGFARLASVRQELAREYDRLLMGHDIIRPLDRDYSSVVPHIYVVRIVGLKDRKALQKRLLDKGIQTGVHYQPNHWLTLYKEPNTPEFPVTDEVFPEILTLPLHPDLNANQVEFICDQLNGVLSV